MNEDDMQAAEPLAGEELERMLTRYARLKLDPSPAQVRRARAAVMEDAWRRRIDPTGRAAAVAGAATPTGRGGRRGLFAGWSPRRLGISMAAAVLAGLVVGSTTFAASRAGGLLYETRLALEELTLPTDATARVDAQLVRAQARLAEAVEASGDRDDPALVAALDAYDLIIDQLTTATGAQAVRALEAVSLHQSILREVAATSPAHAINGLDRALANSERVIERLGGVGPGVGSPGVGSPGVGSPGGGAGRSQDPKTDPTAKPGRTPRPAKTGAPVATPKPGRTPPPPKTPRPAKSETSSDPGLEAPAPTLP